MDESIESKQLSALSGSKVGATETGEGCTVYYSSVEEQIEQSKSHWSLLSDFDPDEDEEVAEVSNVRVFKALQSTSGDHFFFKFNQGGGKSTLQVGEKFAEGGQAELYHAKVKWIREHGREWVVKVFKKGTFLRQLQSQLPQGFLKFKAEETINWKSPTPKRYPRFTCEVYCGTLLEDGRCWQLNSLARPAFGEILDLFSKNSAEARKYKDLMKSWFGESFRSFHLTENTNS